MSVYDTINTARIAALTAATHPGLLPRHLYISDSLLDQLTRELDDDYCRWREKKIDDAKELPLALQMPAFKDGDTFFGMRIHSTGSVEHGIEIKGDL